jgi:hypothetical protein
MLLSRRYAIVGCCPPKGPSSCEIDNERFLVIREAVVECVASLPEDAIVVSGGALGVDSIAASQARQRGLQVVEHLPDYTTHGSRMAPLVRNILIVNDCDEMIAFPAPWSTGTWHAIGVARDKGKPVCVNKI